MEASQDHIAKHGTVDTDSVQNFTLLSATQILKTEYDTDLWLWDGFLPKVGLAAITGPSDCGKSTLVRQLAIAISNGESEFLNSSLSTISKSALYVCTEDMAQGIKSGLEKQFKGLGISAMDNLHFVFDSQNLKIDLKTILTKIKVDLIVVDVWADTFSGNPNNWADVRPDLNLLKMIAVENNCLVLLVHHNVKNSESTDPNKNKMNGSQAIEAKLRAVLELRMSGNSSNERMLTILKGNYIPQDKKDVGYLLKIDGDSLLFSYVTTKQFRGSSYQQDRSRYDPKTWVPRIEKYRKDGLSIEVARSKLLEEYGESGEVPGLTWFKNYLKEPTADRLDLTKAQKINTLNSELSKLRD